MVIHDWLLGCRFGLLRRATGPRLPGPADGAGTVDDRSVLQSMRTLTGDRATTDVR